VSGKLDYLPENYTGLAVVHSLKDIFAASMTGAVNCVVHPRRLCGNFDALAGKLGQSQQSFSWFDFSRSSLKKWASRTTLVPEEECALDTIIADMEGIERKLRWHAGLRVVGHKSYAGSRVHAFHQDGGLSVKVPFERILCGYNRETTEFLRNDAAMKKASVSGESVWIPDKESKIYAFRAGDIWRQTCIYQGAPGNAFIHRAPRMKEGGVPRLLLVATNIN
jgi:hypothetical protein